MKDVYVVKNEFGYTDGIYGDLRDVKNLFLAHHKEYGFDIEKFEKMEKEHPSNFYENLNLAARENLPQGHANGDSHITKFRLNYVWPASFSSEHAELAYRNDAYREEDLENVLVLENLTEQEIAGIFTSGEELIDALLKRKCLIT